MVDLSEEIRQQMSETKAQLSEKLVSLEHQVSDTVHSTGTALHATVGAVQETVETVTGAVQDAIHSISNAFDLRQHMSRHPWLVLGGSVVLGYLAVDLLQGSENTSDSGPDNRSRRPFPDSLRAQKGKLESPFAPAAISAPAMRDKASTDSPWSQLKKAATAAAIGIVQDAASRVVPQAVDFINRTKGSGVRSEYAGSSIQQRE